MFISLCIAGRQPGNISVTISVQVSICLAPVQSLSTCKAIEQVFSSLNYEYETLLAFWRWLSLGSTRTRGAGEGDVVKV